MNAVPYLVLTVPGLGRVARRELVGAGLTAGRVEHDGRSDVIPVAEAPGSSLRTVEDVLAEVGTSRATTVDRIVADLSRSGDLSRSVRFFGSLAHENPHRTFRVVVRVLAERRFRRTQLRDAMAAALPAALPGGGWREADPGGVELWLLETMPGLYRLGVRLTTAETRQHGGRTVERSGALRPAVAAAMVLLAGEGPTVVVDTCCGSGTILAELTARPTLGIGGDVDFGALHDAARANAPGAALVRWDARSLPLRDDAAAAVVTNLPFGKQFNVQGSPVAWYRRALQECRRVAPRTVVLAPPSEPFRRALGRLPFSLDERVDLTLLGTHTAIWSLRRE